MAYANTTTDWSSYLKDPFAWLAALGTVGGLYGSYKQNQYADDYARQQEMIRQQYARDIAAWQQREMDWRNQMHGTMTDFAGQAMGAMSQMGAPIGLDIEKYRKPISANAEKAALRGVSANLARRGVHAGGYADNAAAEAMLGIENKINEDAMEAAVAEADINSRLRASSASIWPAILSAMLGSFGNAPQMPPTPLMPQPHQFTSYGSPGAMGSYMAYRGQRDAAAQRRESDAAFQEWLRNQNNQNSGWGYNPAPRTSGGDYSGFYPWDNGTNF